jgi:shikimate kinase
MRHVVLVGLMGSGKTTVGRLVAASLGWPMHDSDVDIEARTGKTVRELDETIGTEAMHALEVEVLLAALAREARSVVLAAAYTIDEDACVAALQDPSLLVAWLRITPATAAARFSSRGHRPRFGPDPARFLAEQAARRDPRFASVADLTLDADTATPEDLAAQVVAAARQRA